VNVNDGLALQNLQDLYQALCGLNGEALVALRSKVAVRDLEVLFERKAQLAADLTLAQARVTHISLEAAAQPRLTELQDVQLDAVKLEMQLVDALRNSVPLVGKALDAYKKAARNRSSEGLDQSI